MFLFVPSTVPRAIFAIICLILQCIVFLFVVVGTPVDALVPKSRRGNDSWYTCFSMWGVKRCGNFRVTKGVAYKGFGCVGRRDIMSAAAAFSIFSIFLTLIGVILAILNLIGLFKTANIVNVIFAAVAFCSVLVTWACIAGARDRRCKTDAGIEYGSLNGYRLGPTFGLFVTADILLIAVIVMLFFA